MNPKHALIFCFTFLSLAAPCRSQETYPFMNPDLSTDERVADLVSRLTLEEKVLQMLNDAPSIDRLGIPAYNWWNECLHGIGRTPYKVTVFPQAIGMAATWNETGFRQVASAISDEGRAIYNDASAHGNREIYHGLTYWTPNINIFRDPRWGRGQETYGEDPFLTGTLGKAFVAGLQGNDPNYLKAAACAKHYAVHSGPENTRHTFNTMVSDYDLWDTYLPAFRDLVVDANVAGVMCAYNAFGGEPCCGNTALMQDILREMWGFTGYVTSDCGAIDDFYRHHKTHVDAASASADAVHHGTDLDCGREAYRALTEAVQKGLITERQIDTSLSRLFGIRFRLGLFDPTDRVKYANIPLSVLECNDHKALALKMTQQSIVLLKNDGNLLPLKKNLRQIAVIGPNAANDTILLGNYNGFPSEIVNPLTAIRRKVSKKTEVIYEKAIDHTGTFNPEAVASLIERLKTADIVVMVGGISPALEGEEMPVRIEGFAGGDRTSIALPRIQTELMQALHRENIPTVFVMMTGSALGIEWEAQHIPAILNAWYGGQDAGTAIADILFGDYNPSGRLPVTFYKNDKDLPSFNDYAMDGRTYRYFKGEAAFPFGYGLSYSDFAYSPIRAKESIATGEPVELTVDVTNRSKQAGDEVVQVYVSHQNPTFKAPLYSLKAFERIHLAAGETRTLSFTLPAKALSVTDVYGNLLPRPGQVKLYVGGASPAETSARPLPLTVKNLTIGSLKAQETFRNPQAPRHERIIDLLSRLTVEEKIELLRATSPGIPRLQIDKYYHGNEALHGVVRPGRFTVFPQAIGLASMWNPELHQQVASAISDEARARWNELEQGKLQTARFTDLLTFWSPTVNMSRDPRWGRTPETYGEDPYLSGVLGTAFVKGLQGDDPRYLKIVATPKHFAANNEEHNRFVCNPQISERQLREYYFPAFEMCVKEGKAASIMSAYNAINDVPCTANPWLLTKVLRRDWDFNGYVVSDCGGPSLLVSAMKYVKTKEAAATLSIKAGLDLECGDDVYMEPLLNAYKQYMVSEAEIDSAAYRVIRARMHLGLFDDPTLNPYSKIPVSVIGSAEHKELALEAARQSIVLLKNSKNTLPIDTKKVKSIAVVGINAANSEFGDYSGAPANEPVSILQGIRNRAGNKVNIVYAPWKSAKDGLELIQGDNFPEGLKAEYFNNMELKGTPEVRREEWINFEPANQAPDPFLPGSPLSIRWTGKLRPTVSGHYTLSFGYDDGCRLYLDDRLLIDKWRSGGISVDTTAVYLEAGKDYDLKAEYYDDRDYALARLQWRVPTIDQKERIDLYGEAGKAAATCDMVIAVLGINKTIEREGKDRGDIFLPEDQREFIREIYKINPNTVVVLVAGSSLAINWMDERLPAIVNAWYPGEQGGTAVAEVLFGDYNPAGRLPITYYNSLDELPPFDDYDISKGRTYQYFAGKPLYPFGYGLSYTTFKYSKPQVNDLGEELEVSFYVKNTGRYNGDEVSQVYVKLPEVGVVTPVKELKGFQRNTIRKGENKLVQIKVRKDLLRYWNEKTNQFVTPEGKYTFMIGSSSEAATCRCEFLL